MGGAVIGAGPETGVIDRRHSASSATRTCSSATARRSPPTSGSTPASRSPRWPSTRHRRARAAERRRDIEPAPPGHTLGRDGAREVPVERDRVGGRGRGRRDRADLALGQPAAPRPARRRRSLHPRHPRRLPAARVPALRLRPVVRRPARDQRPDPAGPARRPQPARRRARRRPRRRHRGRRLLRGAAAHRSGRGCSRPRPRWPCARRSTSSGCSRLLLFGAGLGMVGFLAAHPDRLRPLLREPDRLGGRAADAVDRARPAAVRRRAADDARVDDRGARRGLPAHGVGQGPAAVHGGPAPRGAVGGRARRSA